jgi:hypothetical protein
MKACRVVPVEPTSTARTRSCSAAQKFMNDCPRPG